MKDSLRRRYFFFLINYFVQGAIGFAYEPIQYLLKDKLKLTPGEAAGFIAWMTLPLLFKPLFGFISDFFPFHGYRRKPHLIVMSIIASLAYFLLAYQIPYNYTGLLIPLALACFGMAFADAVCGGLLVEDGKERNQTGRFQAIQIGALYLSMILCGFGGGWVTTHLTTRMIFLIAGLMPVAIFASSLFIQETVVVRTRQKAGFHFLSFIKTKGFWALSLTLFLWSFYPFLGTVQFYYLSNVLKLTPLMIGSVGTLGSIMGLVGAAAFWKFCPGRDMNRLVLFGPVVMTAVSLAYLFYLGPISVSIVEAVFGFTSVFFRLALLDLIARFCPVDAEATSFALFLALLDLAMYASNALGGKLYDVLERSLVTTPHRDQLSAAFLILIGSLCTFACRWTLPYIQPNSEAS